MTAWYEESFGPDYLIVYKHRDMQGAAAEVARMVGWLGLPAGSSIFDLCCGMGRHALALADNGFRVTGMDLSGVLLDEARRLDREGKVRWLQGDMRRIPLDGPFDAVVNVFTSFGYFDEDDENVRVLHEMGRILKEGGRFLIDYLNPAYVEAHLVPESQRQEGTLSITEKRAIEDGFVRKRIVVSEEGKPDRRYKEQVKLYGLADFRRMLEGSGLAIDSVYGNYDGTGYSAAHSPRLILVGTRKGSANHA